MYPEDCKDAMPECKEWAEAGAHLPAVPSHTLGHHAR